MESIKIKIKVTKEILFQSAFCGKGYFNEDIGKNCAIALAVRDIAPQAVVGYADIVWKWKDPYYSPLPKKRN